MSGGNLSVDEWRMLPEKEKAEYEFVSDEIGCYFKKNMPENSNPSADDVDDYEKLMKGE